MCKEGWCVGLGQEGGSLRESGGNCLKYLKRGWNRKEGRGNKDFKKGGGGWIPLRNYGLSDDTGQLEKMNFHWEEPYVFTKKAVLKSCF